MYESKRSCLRMIAIGQVVTIGLINIVELLSLGLVNYVVAVVVGHAVARESLEMVPQCTHELADHNIIGVLFDNSEQEHTVVLQILVQESIHNLVVNELRGRASSRRRVMMRHVAETIVDLEVSLDERHTTRAGESEDPGEEGVDACSGHHEQPEPDKDENLLVEQIDWQSTLNGVAMVILA